MLADDLLAMLDRWVPGLAEAFVEDHVLREKDGIVYLAAADIEDLPEVLQDGIPGMPVAHHNEGPELLLAGAARVANMTDARTVKVNEKAAELFCYGKRVLGDSVQSAPRLGIGERCIISHAGDVLGLGVVVGKFKGNYPAVVPLHDIGEYLRDQDGVHGHRREEGS